MLQNTATILKQMHELHNAMKKQRFSSDGQGANQPLIQCPSATTAEVTQFLAKSRWESVNGVTTIPYSFDTHGTHWRERLTCGSSEALTPYFQAITRIAMNTWESASNGRVRFVQQSMPIGAFGKGLTIGFCRELPFMRSKTRASSFITLVDNNGLTVQADICFRQYINSAKLTIASENGMLAFYARLFDALHELGHINGIVKHPHDVPSYDARLRKIFNADQCSVMTYPHLYERTNTTNITIDNTELTVTCYPNELGPLDKQLLSEILTSTTTMKAPNSSSDSSSDILYKTISLQFILNTIPPGIEGFAANLAIREQPVFSPLIAKQISNLCSHAILHNCHAPLRLHGVVLLGQIAQEVSHYSQQKVTHRIAHFSLQVIHELFRALTFSTIFLEFNDISRQSNTFSDFMQNINNSSAVTCVLISYLSSFFQNTAEPIGRHSAYMINSLIKHCISTPANVFEKCKSYYRYFWPRQDEVTTDTKFKRH